MARSLTALLDTLCDASQQQYLNPYKTFQWPDKLDAGLWCMPPELISLNGTASYPSLTPEQQRRLSFFEMVNFFSLTLQGEKLFLEKMSRYLYRPSFEQATRYLQHFIDEETKHIVYFGEFCTRYAGKVYPNKHVAGPPGQYAPGEEDFSVFASVFVFEEMGNYYNMQISRDPNVNRIVAEINAMHRREEARHIAFGRYLVEDLFKRSSASWSPEVLGRVRKYLADFVVSTWREFFNPGMYRDVGLADAFSLYEGAFESQASRSRFEQVTRSVSEFLVEAGILERSLSLEEAA